jgi:membrane associated rhomboid family serine protease
MTTTAVGMRCPECARQRTKVKTVRSASRAPQATVALIVANVAVYLAEIFTGSGGLSADQQGTLLVHGELFAPAIHYQHEYWRLVSGGFLHGSILHIGFNMYLLYMLGQMLEPAIGSIRFASIYLVALLSGSMGALLLSPDRPTVGASGAVFGLMGAAVVEMRARGISPMQSGIGGLILINLVFSFVLANVSVGGHIGGLIGGALAALALQEGDKRRSRVLGLAGCLLLGAAAVAGSLAAAGTTTIQT